LEAIAPKDVRKRCREDRPDPPGRQRPRGVFAGRTPPEAPAREEVVPAGPVGLVEPEPRVLERPVLVEPPIAEERFGEPVLVRHLEIPRGHDLVGVDVLGGERDHLAGERPPRLGHGQRPPTAASVSMPGRVRGSDTTPLTALAAAVSGEARKVRPPLPWRP